MKAFLPFWEPAAVPADGGTPGAPTSADDEPVPSDGFRATTLLDVRGLQIAGSTLPDAPVLATGISLSVARGEVIGLVGAAGSGTREIALAIAGRLPDGVVITAGSILIDGQEVVGASRRTLKRLRETRVTLASPAAPTDRPTDDAVGRRLARTLRRKWNLSRTDAARRSLELLAQVGLPDPASTSLLSPRRLDPATLFQVRIAAALSVQPDILVLDEPACALDPAGRSAVLELSRSLRALGPAIIWVSRDLGIVAAGCDRVAVVEAGRIIEQGSAADIVASPRHPHTRGLLEAARATRDRPVPARP